MFEATDAQRLEALTVSAFKNIYRFFVPECDFSLYFVRICENCVAFPCMRMASDPAVRSVGIVSFASDETNENIFWLFRRGMALPATLLLLAVASELLDQGTSEGAKGNNQNIQLLK